MTSTLLRHSLLFFFCLLTSDFLLQAQAPQGIPYQAIARNASGVAIANTAVRVRFSIRDSIATGAIRYQETHIPTTSALGLFSVNVGMGTVVSGTFSGINWGKNAKFLQVELDPSGGTAYTDLGTTQMMSVPYALYSANSIPGPQGVQGETGPAGINGIDGKSILSGISNPESGIGNNGDFYINTSSNTLFGPKTTEAWPSQGVMLVGPTGAPGATGPQGPPGPSGSGGFVHYIGESFGGGVVFHVYRDQAGAEHGLIVALANQSDAQAWSNVTNLLAGASSSWDGLANSNAIAAQAGHINSAAKLCLDYEAGGFSDWYLPSNNELNLVWNNLLILNKSLLGISGAFLIFPISEGSFWSSSETGTGQAISRLYHGGISSSSKSAALQVRAIRAF